MVTGKTALSPFSVPMLSPAFLPSRRVFDKAVVTLKIGDQIQYKGDDNEDLFFQATIVSIVADSNELEIQPLRMDEVDEEFSVDTMSSVVTMSVNIDDIQFYRPPEQGDIVWSKTPDPDEEEGSSWKKYKILFLTPFGQAELLMTEEYAEEYSEEFESYANTAISRDFKNILLTSNGVPEIRLRHYS